ncbi:MAG: YdcF family protein, partial [Gammaproteobacteria bacterium]
AAGALVLSRRSSGPGRDLLTWAFLLKNLVKALLLPPGGPLVLLLIGLFLLGRARRTGVLFIALGTVSLVAVSTPWVAGQLRAQVETYAAFDPDSLQSPTPASGSPQAIVILGGGRDRYAPEYGGSDTVGSMSLVRLRYGAWLHRQTGLPILVTGGTPGTATVPEASLMAQVLEDEFQVPVRWRESRSENTEQNARLSYTLLKDHGVERILLVTQGFHMPRAISVFERAGFSVTAAPTQVLTRDKGMTGVFDLLPSASALLASRRALHEMLGRFWYTLSGV